MLLSKGQGQKMTVPPNLSKVKRKEKNLVHKYDIHQIEVTVIPETDLTEKIKQFSQK